MRGICGEREKEGKIDVYNERKNGGAEAKAQLADHC